MTATLLVQMISLFCLNVQTDSFYGYCAKNKVSDYSSGIKEEYTLDCFDYFNNCMVGPGGVIKASDWKGCKKSWEKKNK